MPDFFFLGGGLLDKWVLVYFVVPSVKCVHPTFFCLPVSKLFSDADRASAVAAKAQHSAEARSAVAEARAAAAESKLADASGAWDAAAASEAVRWGTLQAAGHTTFYSRVATVLLQHSPLLNDLKYSPGALKVAASVCTLAGWLAGLMGGR